MTTFFSISSALAFYGLFVFFAALRAHVRTHTYPLGELCNYLDPPVLTMFATCFEFFCALVVQ